MVSPARGSAEASFLDRGGRAKSLRALADYDGWGAPSFSRENMVTAVSLKPRERRGLFGAVDFRFDSKIVWNPVFSFKLENEEYRVSALPIEEKEGVWWAWVRERGGGWHRVGGEESHAVRALASAFVNRLSRSLPRNSPRSLETERSVSAVAAFLEAHDAAHGAVDFADDGAHAKWLEGLKSELEGNGGLRVFPLSGLVENRLRGGRKIAFSVSSGNFTVQASGGAPSGASLHSVFLEERNGRRQLVAEAWRDAVAEKRVSLCGREKQALVGLMNAFGEKVRRERESGAGDAESRAVLDKAAAALREAKRG